MSQVELAKRYAKALLQLGHQKGKVKEYQTQLKSVSDVIFGQPEIAEFFMNTAVSQENKRKSLESLFAGAKFDEDVRGFLFLLIDKSRVSALPEIVKAGRSLLDIEEGVTRGKIRSANNISEQTRADYEKKIGGILKKKIFLETSVDEKIMGGVRVEVGGWTFDDSLQSHLGQLSEKLLNKSL